MRRALLAFAALLLAAPAVAADALSDAALAGLLTSRHFDEVARYYQQHGDQREEQTPLRMTLFCAAYIYRVDFSNARACLARFQAVIDAGPGTMKVGTLVLDYHAKPQYMLAEVDIDEGDYPGALRAAEHSYQTARAAAPHAQREFDLLTALQELGLAHALLGHAAEARGYAEAMQQAVVLDSDLKRATIGPALRLGRARIFTALDDYQAAAGELARPDANLNTWVAAVVDQSYLALGIDFIKARALLEAGKLEPARALYEAILAHPQSVVSGDVLWSVRYDLGRLALLQGRTDAAIDHLRHAIEVIERQRATINTEASRIGFVGDKQRVYGALVTALVDAGRASEAFEIVERAKSRALVDLLAGRRTFVPRHGDAATVRNLLGEIDRLDRSAATPPQAGTDAVAERARGLGRVQAELAQAAPEVLPLVSVTPVAASAIRAQLAADEALLEYYQDGDRLYAFAADRDTITAAVLDGVSLDAAVRRFRAAVQSPRGDPEADGRALYDRLIAPVARHLAGKRLLTIVPHGPLHYLPFSALRSPAGFLIEHYELRFLPSAGVLGFLGASAHPPPKSLLVLGDPDLGDPRYDLPGADAEAQAIAALVPDAAVYLRARATKAVIVQNGGDYRRLHFAGHGQFNAELPLASRLMLAGHTVAEQQLTADEIYDLHLNADLVTLSACETGLSRVESGDDVVGLTRGLLFAGSRAIVASLWEVSDLETKYLMVAFYEALRTLPKAAALRQAQLATLAKYPAPVFWSAFQLAGAAD